MAPTIFSRSAKRKPPTTHGVSLSNSGQIEPLMGMKRNKDLSSVVKEKAKVARRHYEGLGEEAAYRHVKAVLRAADEAGMLSMEMIDQILYHSLNSESYLPTDVRFSQEFLETFYIQRRLKALDSKKGDRSSDYRRLFCDPSIDPTKLVMALRVRMAEMMAAHDAATAIAIATVKRPGMFPVHDSLDDVRYAWTEAMMKVYLSVANCLGHTDAYRVIRDNAMRYRHPSEFREVAAMVGRRTGALADTKRFIMSLLRDVAVNLNQTVLVARNYQEASALFHRLEPGTMVAAFKPDKGPGGLLKKSLDRGMDAKDVHDPTGCTIITENRKQMDDAASFLHGGITSLAERLGIPGLRIDEFQDYVSNPKSNGYSSYQLDTTPYGPGSDPNPPLTPAEMQVKTLEMHKTATEGSANHDSYKGSYLDNEAKQRIREGAARMEARS